MAANFPVYFLEHLRNGGRPVADIYDAADVVVPHGASAVPHETTVQARRRITELMGGRLDSALLINRQLMIDVVKAILQGVVGAAPHEARLSITRGEGVHDNFGELAHTPALIVYRGNAPVGVVEATTARRADGTQLNES